MTVHSATIPSPYCSVACATYKTREKAYSSGEGPLLGVLSAIFEVGLNPGS